MSNLIGKTLGPYRIIEQIGLGGMATVFKAYQPSMERYVALKVLSTHLSQTPTFVKRFQQEAKVIAKLEHLHILPVYDHGEEDDYLYLVMRFIEAGTLKDRLLRGALSLEETRRVVNQIGSALEYAHQLGVIHRDLKPSNILIDHQGDCYLTDFGIAKMVEGSLNLTGSNVIGTPQYMAPEQGESVKVDERADIYAMGVVIYEMVTGRLPFDAETPFAVVMKHLTEPLPLPRSLRPDLPEEVERVILRALAKHPADRYQTMRDLVTAFDQATQAAPADARAAAPAPLATGEASAATGTSSTGPIPTQPLRVTLPPLWIVAAAGLGLLVLVVAGLILSQVPGQVTISGGQVQVVLSTEIVTPPGEGMILATPTAVKATIAAPGPTSTSTATAITTPTPTPTPTPTATSTPIPLPPGYVSPGAPPTEGRILESCERIGPDTGLCIFPYRSGTHTAILQDADLYLHNGDHFSWNPDGKQIAFAAATAPDAGPQIYIVNADGAGLTQITFDGDYNHQPSWSPDGEWIAFTHGADLAIVRPDGSDLTIIHRRIGGRPCILEPHWSPDSQWLVGYADVNGCPDVFPVTREVWVFSRDGQTVRVVTPPMIHQDASFKVGSLGFSPDGTQVIYIDEEGRHRIVRADGSTEPEFLTDWPDWWNHNFYPQWAGENAAATSVPETQAEQSRAFAEPILAAIANHPPDFQDDFSDPTSGWESGAIADQSGWEEGERGYADGEYYITVPAAKLRPQKPDMAMTCAGSHPINQQPYSDMVLEVEGRFVQAGEGNWSVNFRQWHEPATGAEGKYHVMFESGVNVRIDKRLFTPSATGAEGQERHWNLSERQGLPVQADSKPNRLQIIAIGPQIAVYVNGEPTLFGTDPNFDEQSGSGLFDLVICNLGDTPMEARWDNLKIWDISDLELPTTSPAGPTADTYITTDSAWKFSEQLSAGWEQLAYDDSGWATPDSRLCQDLWGLNAACLWEKPYRYIPNHALYFRQAFNLAQVPPHARLVTLADDDVDIYVNGQRALQDDTGGISWWETDITSLLQPGSNVLALRGVDTGEGTAFVQAALGLCEQTEDKYQPIVEIMNHWEDWFDGQVYLEAVDAPCDSGVVEVAYRVDGGEWQTVERHKVFQLPPGEHDVEARALDGAGRQGFDKGHFRIGQPLATPAPNPGQAFVEPILAAIKDRPPDYQDDFSDPASGWDIGQSERGEVGYKDGKYFILSTSTSDANGDWGSRVFSDFVLEVDVQYVSGEAGIWFVILRDWRKSTPPPGFYGIESFLNEDLVRLCKWGGGYGYTRLVSSPPNVRKPDYETNQVMAILKGNQLAFYINGQPAGLVTDDTFSKGTIGLAAGTSSDTPLEVHYDNLKVWDISDLSLP